VGQSSSKENSMNKKKMELLGGTLAGMMFLSGCSTITETSRTPLVETATLPTPAITLEYIVGAGGEMNAAQKSFLEGTKGTEYKEAVLKYAKYWQKVKLIGQNITIGIGVMPDMNDTTDQSKMLPYFELPGTDYVNKKCTLPWVQFKNYVATGDVSQLLPPNSDKLLINADVFCMSTVVTKDSVPALAGIPVDSVLANVDGQPVYIDAKTKEVVGVLDEQAQWKENSLIEGNIFQDPQSEADFANLVESPSPIDNPEDFAKWQDEYLNQIDEKLKTWDGPIMNIAGTTVDFGIQVLALPKNKWQAISSYKYIWQGKEILTKTYVTKDNTGALVPFSITYTTPNSSAFPQIGYQNPSKEQFMYIRYEWEMAKEYGSDQFIDSFLPDKDKDIYFNNWRTFFGTKDITDEERALFSRTPFVIANFG
jgi:hypothetical protein